MDSFNPAAEAMKNSIGATWLNPPLQSAATTGANFVPRDGAVRYAYANADADFLQDRIEEFERWIARVKADAWDEGYWSGFNRQLQGRDCC